MFACRLVCDIYTCFISAGESLVPQQFGKSNGRPGASLRAMEDRALFYTYFLPEG